MTRLVQVFVLAVCFSLSFAVDSHAAVQLQPAQASAGSVADLIFRVSNDRADAFTKKVQILFPSAPAFERADATAPIGWSSSVDARTGRVTSIAFESGKIDGANAGDFTVTVTVPIVGDRAVFTVLQEYSDGQVVRWAADPVSDPGGANPAPVFSIVGGATSTTSAPAVSTTTTDPSDAKAIDMLGTPSVGKIFIGVGVAIIFTVLMRGRRLKRQGRK